MIVDEEMLARFRGMDGLCRMRRELREFGTSMRYADFPALLERMQQDTAPPPILEGGVKPSPTYEVFQEAWSQAERGRRAVPVLAFTSHVPLLPATRRWLALEHQCAGYLCGQVPMIATVLEARDRVQTAFDRIAAENFYACNGWFEGPETDEDVTQRYLTQVAELGLSCGETALEQLCEGLYPVDATPAALHLIADDVDDLVPLLDRPDAQPLILFLSENSD